MDLQGVIGLGCLLLVILVVAKTWRRRRHRPGIGSGAVGAVYDLLSEDKRRAVEIIVEGDAEKRRPEYPDDTVPPPDSYSTGSSDHQRTSIVKRSNGFVVAAALSLVVGVALLGAQATRPPAADEKAIAAWIDAHNGEALSLLERAVNINSGTDNLAGVRQVGTLFKAEFDALGFKTTWVDGAPFGARGSSRRDARGQRAEDPAHRPSRHRLSRGQPVSEVRAPRREHREGARHHRHEGRRRDHRPGPQGAERRRRARRR